MLSFQVIVVKDALNKEKDLTMNRWAHWIMNLIMSLMKVLKKSLMPSTMHVTKLRCYAMASTFLDNRCICKRGLLTGKSLVIRRILRNNKSDFVFFSRRWGLLWFVLKKISFHGDLFFSLRLVCYTDFCFSLLICPQFLFYHFIHIQFCFIIIRLWFCSIVYLPITLFCRLFTYNFVSSFICYHVISLLIRLQFYFTIYLPLWFILSYMSIYWDLE